MQARKRENRRESRTPAVVAVFGRLADLRPATSQKPCSLFPPRVLITLFQKHRRHQEGLLLVVIGRALLSLFSRPLQEQERGGAWLFLLDPRRGASAPAAAPPPPPPLPAQAAATTTATERARAIASTPTQSILTVVAAVTTTRRKKRQGAAAAAAVLLPRATPTTRTATATTTTATAPPPRHQSSPGAPPSASPASSPKPWDSAPPRAASATASRPWPPQPRRCCSPAGSITFVLRLRILPSPPRLFLSSFRDSSFYSRRQPMSSLGSRTSSSSPTRFSRRCPERRTRHRLSPSFSQSTSARALSPRCAGSTRTR